MIKHTVTYDPFEDGNVVSKDLYFNIKMQDLQHLLHVEGWEERLKVITEWPEDDQESLEYRTAVWNFWQEALAKSYGERTNDGFEQSKKISKKFMKSDACSALLEDLLLTKDSDLVARFMEGLFPSKVRKVLNEEAAKENAGKHAEPNGYVSGV